MSFKGNSTIVFHDNTTECGGDIGVYGHVYFQGNSTTIFSDNIANDGGTLYVYNTSNVTFTENSVVTFNNNNAIQNGGAMYFHSNCYISFRDFANVTFNNNQAVYGGAIFANHNSQTLLMRQAIVTFSSNRAIKDGGAVYYNSHCNVTLKENVTIKYEKNNAVFGGAIYLNDRSWIAFIDNSTTMFTNNKAARDGGAISINTNSFIKIENYTMITFTSNSAQYGGAMCFDITYTTLTFNHHEGDIFFINNIARIAGTSMYFDSSRLCDASCLNNRTAGIKGENKHFIATPPSKLELHDPAICIDNDNKTQCNAYHLNYAMLGEEINIPACVLDYYNQPVNTAQFLLHDTTRQNYYISGSNQVTVSCGSFHGISYSIVGNHSLTKSVNYSINISLIVDRNYEWKQISVNLTVELTQCYPGFWQYHKSQKCECYNASDVVFCSGSSSTIKRGYWFGSVTGKPTVAFCPVNYCNFTCCETYNGYYHLSPVRDNQCRSHRSGTACGNCDDGYTLPFYIS